MPESLPKIVVIGGGGHAKVVIDLIRSVATHEVCGVIDGARSAEFVNGAPVLGGDNMLPLLFSQGIHFAALGIGSNEHRSHLGRTALHIGFELPAFASPTAFLSPTCLLGEGTVVLPHAVVQAEASIGRFCIVNTAAVVEHDCEFADGVHVAPGSIVCGGVVIGAQCFICAGAIVIPNVRLATGTVIGAGSVVLNTIDQPGVYVGSPARLVREAPDPLD